MSILTCPQCGAKNRVEERAASTLQPVCGKCGAKLDARAAAASGGDGHPLEVTDASFSDAVLGVAGKPVLVDCWAAWCGPCRMLSPTIDALAGESAGRYVVAKLDTDANPRTASAFRVSSIPTMLIFKDGLLVDQLIGLQPKQNIAAALAKHA